jgi:uncharacterized protein
MLRPLALVAAFLLAPLTALAQCGGTDLLATMDPAARTSLNAAIETQPYPRGNLWRATRGDATVTLVGTYHFADPRHDPTMDRITPLIKAAATVLVEAGPEEEAALMQAVARDPDLMLITEGPSLLEQMEPAEWDRLANAMSARGIPAFMAAKFKPWYVSMMLGMPACAMDPVAIENGLDKRVIALAGDQGLPVRALEPYDTLFKMFGTMPAEDQLSMIRSTLLFEDQAEDFSFTLAEAYFAEDSRTMWEFMRRISREVPGITPEQSDAEFARLEEALINARNRSWIPVIEGAAADGPVFVAFGALHLSGDEGVLNLLDQAGWVLERLEI